MAGVFFRTKSLWDGSSILVAAVLPKSAKNSKTGALAQVYILPDNGKLPHVAWKDGDYDSVCGDCPHKDNGACYVDRTKGSRGVMVGIRNGKSYREVTVEGFRDALAGLAVRWGADGDPAMIPEAEFRVIASQVTSCTGYTHQWRWAHWLKGHCMACDGNLRGERRANPVIIAHGLAHKVTKYKTFRMSLALHDRSGSNYA